MAVLCWYGTRDRKILLMFVKILVKMYKVYRCILEDRIGSVSQNLKGLGSGSLFIGSGSVPDLSICEPGHHRSGLKFRLIPIPMSRVGVTQNTGNPNQIKLGNLGNQPLVR